MEPDNYITKIAAFDFDYTMINANSLNYLNKLVMKHQALKDGVQFRTPSIADLNKFKYSTDSSDRIQSINARFAFMHSQCGVREEQMIECLSEIRISDSLKQLLRNLSRTHQLMVISDSNKFVIETVLNANGILELFGPKIYANPSLFDQDGRLVVKPLSSEYFGTDQSFNCELATCRPNICKGQVLSRAINGVSGASRRLIYVGDGKIDYCPGLVLSDNDRFFVKSNSSLMRLIEVNGGELKSRLRCQIKLWKNAKEISDQLE